MDAPDEGPQGGPCPLWWWTGTFSALSHSFNPQDLPHLWAALGEGEENGQVWMARKEWGEGVEHIPILLLTPAHPNTGHQSLMGEKHPALGKEK